MYDITIDLTEEELRAVLRVLSPFGDRLTGALESAEFKLDAALLEHEMKGPARGAQCTNRGTRYGV